jgi:tetratricopeptide (TPR) repeat protein
MPQERKKAKAKKAKKKPNGRAGDEPGNEYPADAFSRLEAADAACLVGELHLQKGDFKKAIEAFTRALENHATPDAYQGRAQAYRALAERDEREAQEHDTRP